VRWLKWQTLPLFSQRRFQGRQGCAGLDGDNQLTGLVAADARQAAGVQQLALQALAIKILGAATPNAQRGARSRCGTDAVDELCKVGVHRAMLSRMHDGQFPVGHELFEISR
jgi:hypothetical protein